MTIIDALTDRHLLGGLPQFANVSTWSKWFTFLRAMNGLPMSSEDLASFQRFTGRTTPQRGGYAEGVAQVGVQSGKLLRLSRRGSRLR